MSEPKPDKHPPPWRWTPEDCPEGRELLDAAGGYPIGMSGEEIRGVDPIVLELIRLAPQMEVALRAAEWGGTLPDTAGGGDCCPVCEADASPHMWVSGTLVYQTPSHHGDCALGEVIAALDAAWAAP